nr:DUF6153 family protein [Paeniglutamicibacter terrestris]
MTIQRKDLAVSNPHALPPTRSVLSKIGWLAVVLAIIGGLLGMHVIGGVHALEPSSVSSTATATTHTATPNHHGFSSALPSASPAATATMAAPAHQGDPFSCGGSSPDGQASMGGHDTCIPSFGPDLLVVPLPGMLTWAHPRTAFTSIPGPKSKGRIPDPPSLTQLSIIRT